MSPRDVPAPRPSRQRDPIDTPEETEASARQRAVGIYDAEMQKRRQLGADLVTELRRPLIEGHGPSESNAIAALTTRARPAR